jgi:molybdopterin-binding protein
MKHKEEKSTILRLNQISKKYPSFSIRDISFSLRQGDYFILLGVSGAGKSLVLETIAGLITPDHGTIEMDGKDITKCSIQDRKIGLVFQDLALFPHLTVFENICYPLKGKIRNHQERKEIAEKTASLLDIGELLNRKPKTLSGGEQQRVALARSLVHKPRVLLLDEPLASLDVSLKASLRSRLRQLNRDGQTIIHVTHDYEEALALGNNIAVMHEGMIIQTGQPSEVFSRPRSEFVAHFTGARNFYSVNGSRNPGEVLIRKDLRIRVNHDKPLSDGYILLRSEDVFLSRTHVETSATNNFNGIIREIIPHKAGYEVSIDIGIPIFAIITPDSLNILELKEGESCQVHFKASTVRFIPF